MRFQRLRINPIMAKLCLGFSLCFCLGFSFSAQALEFRTVVVPKAVLYDAPSPEASKTFILPFGYPVEVIVNLGAWLKVRDQQGALNWVETKSLTNKRTVLVTSKTELKAQEDGASALLATIEKDVVLALVSPTAKNGWIKVKHRDGLTGFVQASDVWGF